MISNLLNIVGNVNDHNFYFESKSEAFLYALIGFLVVFAGICIIIAIIWLIGFIMKKTNNLAFLSKKNKTKSVEASANNQPEQNTSDEIPDEIKAAIVAAIMAYYTQESKKCDFVVKRIKRL